MTSAREEILQRIRLANANAGVRSVAVDPGVKESSIEQAAAGPFAHGAGAHAETPGPLLTSREDIVELFAERVADYQAIVERCSREDMAERIAVALVDADGVVLPEGFPPEWSNALPEKALRSDPGNAEALDRIEAVMTTSAAGIARTGTIVLDHSDGQGRRALTLVPDLHVCIVRESDIYADVPQAVAALRRSIDAGRALTWVSGPSATSDIELSRVEGVHGPRRLHVIIVD